MSSRRSKSPSSKPPSTVPQGAPPPAAPPAARPERAALTIDHATAIEAMRFYPAILGWVRRCGVPAHDAPDVAINVVLRALQSWETFVPRAEQHAAAARRTWLFVSAYRAAAAWCKNAARVEPHDPADMEALAEQGAQHPSPEEETLDQEARSERAAEVDLEALRPQTSDENWRAFVAHEIEGVPVAVLADLEGAAPSTIYNRLRVARRDLKAAILRLRARGIRENSADSQGAPMNRDREDIGRANLAEPPRFVAALGNRSFFPDDKAHAVSRLRQHIDEAFDAE